jgi:hypothetical protein
MTALMYVTLARNDNLPDNNFLRVIAVVSDHQFQIQSASLLEVQHAGTVKMQVAFKGRVANEKAALAAIMAALSVSTLERIEEPVAA